MKRFKQYLSELFISNANDVVEDADILRLSIVAELDAVTLYEKLASKTSNPHLKKVLLDVANEEKVHSGEFLAMLKKMDPSQSKAEKEGKREVEAL
jgi:rubrerythrin